MIGFSDLFECGCTGQKAQRIRDYLKDNICLTWAADAGEYKEVKKALTEKVEKLNKWCNGVPLSVVIKDPSAITPGQISILRGKKNTCILWLRVYYLLHWHRCVSAQEGGEQ